MFTGIIEEIGKISKQTYFRGGKRMMIRASKVLHDLEINHSIAVSGVCLTVIQVNDAGFIVEAVGETLKKSTLANIKTNTTVNLERALRPADRLGGHLVQGHVNGLGVVLSLTKRGENWFMEVMIPATLQRYVIPEGSIAIDGVSLTIAHIDNKRVGISVIPHTFKHTIISSYKIGQKVNIEIDFLARYVEKLVAGKNINTNYATFSEDWFKTLGF
jgi:riboflavin synthase